MIAMFRQTVKFQSNLANSRLNTVAFLFYLDHHTLFSAQGRISQKSHLSDFFREADASD